MEKFTLLRFTKIINEQKQQILASHDHGQFRLSTERDELFDEVDHAVADLEQGMKVRLGNREALYLRKLEDALARIVEGTYGQCVSCGVDIGERRLEVRPTAELCIDCKEESERAENLSVEGRKPKSLGRTLAEVRAENGDTERTGT